MNCSKIIYRRDTATEKEIQEHLFKCARNFKPPLDTYTNIEEYSKKIFNFANTFEAWEDDELIGVAAVYYNDFNTKVGFITNVSVIKEKQNQGIAHQLLENAIRYGREMNFNQVNLEVRDIHNNRIINLYKNLGFVTINIENNKIIMSNLLKK